MSPLQNLQGHAALLLAALFLFFPDTASAQQQESDSSSILPWKNEQIVTLNIEYTLVPSPRAEDIVFRALLPDTIEGQQKILKVDYPRKPTRVYKKDGGRYAEWKIDQITPDQPIIVGAKIKASMKKRDLATVSAKPRKPKPLTQAESKRWLRGEPFIETENPAILEAAKSIQGQTRAQRVLHIMNSVTEHLEFGGYDPKDRGAAWAWENKKGDCNEFAALFIALCRADKIPARLNSGFATHLHQSTTMKHAWAEVHFPKFGWVPFDPVLVEAGVSEARSLPVGYLILGHTHREAELHGYQFSGYSIRRGRIELKESYQLTRHSASE